MSARARFKVASTRLRPALPVIAIASLLALIPTTTCAARILFGIPCPACGLTRASLAIARFDFEAAHHLHPLALAIAAITAAMVIAAFVASDHAWSRAVKIVTGAVGIALVAVWALRFVGFFGGPVAP